MFDILMKIYKSKIYNNRVNLFEGFINEAKYTVRWSDGVQAGKELKSEKEAMQYAKGLIKSLKKLQYVSVHKPGMSSTADKEDLLADIIVGSIVFIVLTLFILALL